MYVWDDCNQGNISLLATSERVCRYKNVLVLQGIGRRFSNLVLKKADIDMNKRAGEMTEEEVERVITIMQNPRQYKIPDWFLNRQKDIKDGKYSQVST